MTDTLGVALVLALLYVGWQLRDLRRGFELDRSETARRRHYQRFDEVIRKRCPNLFFDVGHDFPEKLREWYAIFERKHDYFKDHEKYSSAMSPHSPELATWGEIRWSRLDGISDEHKTDLWTLSAITEAFIKDAPEKTDLSGSEIGFLAFDVWRENVLSERPEQFRILASFLPDLFAVHLQGHARKAVESSGLPPSPAGPSEDSNARHC